jgi:uncharacterized protein YigE (DUF2233 family)
LFWKKPDGIRIGTFDNLAKLAATSGERVVFATNAGIFDESFSPCGVFVVDGRELVPINLKPGPGNFHIKPNGVFLVTDHAAAIVESEAYLTLTHTPFLATQSGPLLVVNDQINPAFSATSENRRIRSGIGVISSDHIAFAISREPVTFYEFASFFKNTLGCRDALYLDGEISRFWPDQSAPSVHQEDFAGIFAITVHE